MSATAVVESSKSAIEQQARRYTRLRRRIALVSWGLQVALLAALILGWTRTVRDIALSFSSRPAIALLVYLLLIGGIFEVVRLPFDYYSGYIVEHRFGLSRMTLWTWTKDRVKSLVLGALLGIAAVELLYWALRRDPATWWIWVAAIFVLFAIVMAKLAPVLLFPLFFKFQPLQNPELEQRITVLSERLGARVRGVWEWKLGEKSSKSNAALVGWGSTRRVVLADTLLEKRTPDEIEAVVAHELAHHIHRDIPKAIFAQAVLTFVTLYLIDRVLVWATPRLGYAGLADFANLPLVLLVSTGYSLLVMPAANAYSRWRERRADEFALRATRNRQAFIGAMRKLAEQNLAEPKPHPAAEFLFHSHPPVYKRIAFAERFKL